MKLLDIIREQVSINENIAQAEKLLNNLQMPLDNPDYVNLKNNLERNGNSRYLGLLLSLSLNHVNQTGEPKEKIFEYSSQLYNKIKNNEQYIKLLSKSFFEYKSYDELSNDLSNLKNQSMYIKFSKLIMDKTVKNDFIQKQKDYIAQFLEPISYYFNNIEGTKLSSTFKKKINRYKDVPSLIGYLKVIVKFHKEGFNYDDWKKRVQGNHNDFKIVYDDSENERILILTNTWEGVKQIGSPSWCIYQSYGAFINYTARAGKNLYVFLDFSADDVNYSIIGFTMDDGGNVTASHLMDDSHIEGVVDYLKKLGVYFRFKQINYEVEEIKKHKKLTNLVIDNSDSADRYYEGIKDLLSVDDYDYEFNTCSFPMGEEHAVKITKRIKKSVTSKMKEILSRSTNSEKIFTITLMDYLKIFQNFKIYYADRHYDSDYYRDCYFTDEFFTVNLFSDNKVLDFEHENFSINDVLINVFIRYKDLKKETYQTFIEELIKLNGREKVFDLIRQRKERSSEEYSNIEFFNIKNKNNMASRIFDKIKNSRREGVVDLTPQEVKYGVENGLKEQLKKLYTSVIPYFKENQVDYDAMQIFKYLGMLKELTNAVEYKFNMYGKDSLNSIEYSLYQYR